MQIIQSPSPNFYDRHGYVPEIVVTHCTDGYWDSDMGWLRNPASQVSSHFVISYPSGEIHQLVAEENAAWHAGRHDGPRAKVPLKKTSLGLYVNPNWYSFGIEVSLKPPLAMTPAQEKSWLWLVKDYLSPKWNIPLDRAHNWGHFEVFSGKTCPAPIKVDDLVSKLYQPPAMVDREAIKNNIIELLKKL